MKLSIVISTHNKAQYLMLVLLSYCAQTVSKDSFEVVICDDNSTDNTEEVVKDFCARGLFPIKYVHQVKSKRGRAAGLNTALRRASGDIVICSDDDWLFPPNCIAQHLRMHRHLKNTAVIGRALKMPYINIRQINERKILEGKFIFCNKSKIYTLKSDMGTVHKAIFTKRGRLKKGIITAEYSFTPNTSVPMPAIKKVGLFDEHFIKWGNEDVELGFRLYHMAHLDFIFKPENIIYHLDHKVNITEDKVMNWLKNVNYQRYKTLAYYYSHKYPIRKEILRAMREVLR